MSMDGSLQDTTKPTSHIENLPLEVLEEVFTLYYLSKVFSPFVLKLVCRQWCMIVDSMPIMRSNILLVPNIHCSCCQDKCISAYHVQCGTLSSLNLTFSRLKSLKCKLTVLGCDKCFQESDVYDLDLDKNMFSLRCRSLQIFTATIRLANTLLKSIEDVMNLECFKLGPMYTPDSDESVQETLYKISLDPSRTLRKLGTVYWGRFRLTDQNRLILRRLDSLTLNNHSSSLNSTGLENLASNLGNISKLKLKSTAFRTSENFSIPITSPRLQHLFLVGRSLTLIPTEIYTQLTTLKMARVVLPSPFLDQYMMPNLQYLYIHYCYMGLEWVIAPNLQYLFFCEYSEEVRCKDRRMVLFGSQTKWWSVRPRVIAVSEVFTNGEETAFKDLWERVEEVEIHTLAIPLHLEALARHLFDTVQRGDEGLCSLRRISILLQRTVNQDIKAGNEFIESLKGAVNVPLRYGHTHSVQIRHRWAYVKRDSCLRTTFMTEDGGGWLYWAP
jgi:hypothetical protein